MSDREIFEECESICNFTRKTNYQIHSTTTITINIETITEKEYKQLLEDFQKQGTIIIYENTLQCGKYILGMGNMDKKTYNLIFNKLRTRTILDVDDLELDLGEGIQELEEIKKTGNLKYWLK